MCPRVEFDDQKSSIAITFDDNARRVTFEADGYFQETDEQIFDLVDLNQNGRAELIYMNFNRGYWITIGI